MWKFLHVPNLPWLEFIIVYLKRRETSNSMQIWIQAYKMLPECVLRFSQRLKWVLFSFFSPCLWLSQLVSHSQACWRRLLSILSQNGWTTDPELKEERNEPLGKVYWWFSPTFEQFVCGSLITPMLTWVVTLGMDSVKSDWFQSRIFANQLMWSRRRIHSWCCSC